MSFAARPPSTTWEPIPLGHAPHGQAWVWFKPVTAPTSAVFQIPEPVFHDPAVAAGLTLRRLSHAVGIDPAQVAGCTLFGTPFDSQGGTNPAWDHLITPPGAVPDPTIALFVNPAFAEPAVPVMAPPAALPPLIPISASDPALASLFVRMDADWRACLQIEIQLAAAAKQLESAMLRVNSLNREFSPDEARCADQIDKRDWQDARRWLRDAATRITRVLKDHQMGMTSVAGKRTSFETIYLQYVQPRRHFDGIEQTERDFEAYRKMLQTLLSAMSTTQSSAVQEGERRAQLVLSRVSAKMRTARAKRG